MQIDYARYPDGGCYDGSGAEQNPAYRVSGNRPSGRFFFSERRQQCEWWIRKT